MGGGMNKLQQDARQQFGVVSRQQVVAALGNRSSIAWKVSTGELERVHELAYRLRGAPLSRGRTATEGLMIAGEGSMLSHWTAARLHGLDGIEGRSAIDVSVGSGTPPPPLPGLNFHRLTRESGGFVWKSGWPIARVERTIVSLASELTEEQLELALDSANRRYKLFSLWLADYIKQLKPQGRPGLVALKMLLVLRGGGVTDSPLEARVLRKLRQHGLKPSEKPIKIYDRQGNYVIRLDFAWPDLKVGIHVDSFLWHSQRQRFDRDARQRSRLAGLGWRCVIVTHNTFKDGSWLEDLLALLDPQSELGLY